jgi:hypothetical protein
MDTDTVMIWTNAPEAYDYNYATRTGRSGSWNGYPVWEVAIKSDNPLYHSQYQIGRYASGMNVALTAEEYEKQSYDDRVNAYEREGMTRSDAQGVVDAEDLRGRTVTL